jgi:acetyl-CoA C-acetyltransferase
VLSGEKVWDVLAMTSPENSSYIFSAKRSAIASFQGALANLSAPEIAAPVIRAAVQNYIADVQEVYFGCVLTAGLGQAPARQASIKSGISDKVPCTTIGKVCGSGLKAVMLADLGIRCGETDLVLAGGMESMSQAPYLLPKIRTGLRLGNGELIDSMIKDGLWDVYNNFHMGSAAELCVKKYGLSRENQDAYAAESFKRAQEATQNGKFQAEIVPIEIKSKKGAMQFSVDEGISKFDAEKSKTLKPVFDAAGTITAANASSLSDGAAALLVGSSAWAKKIKPLARIVAHSQAAQDPAWFTTAPAESIKKLLQKSQLKVSQIDAWEINEAFAAVALANQKILELDPAKLNMRGGAIALGHPIGASGARVLVTLVHTLQQTKKKYGIASLCIGGGEAVSMLIENLDV